MSGKIKVFTYKDIFLRKKTVGTINLKMPADKRLVVFSDSHLDGKFDQKTFDKLNRIITNADLVVINGDFWNDSTINFDDFLRSPWKGLFPLLKNKSYYLSGNHDMPRLFDERVFLFCKQIGFRVKIQAGKTKLHIEHGHLLSSKIVQMIMVAFEGRPRLLHFATLPFAIFDALSEYLVKHKDVLFFQNVNNDYKQKRLSVSENDEYFVMGHSHSPEFDESKRYINLGFTHNGYFSYLEVYKNKITLHKKI